MNISLLADLAFTFRVLFVGKTLGGKITWFFFLMEKCTTAEGFVFHNAEPILSMSVILIYL